MAWRRGSRDATVSDRSGTAGLGESVETTPLLRDVPGNDERSEEDDWEKPVGFFLIELGMVVDAFLFAPNIKSWSGDEGLGRQTAINESPK